ncbi:carboxypeptidase regulatory-like domain-containing protein (plasmid) [Hymenobacter qilianensis]|uniref:Carboxypeptidase regulatory-like domain-containing protein n=1 Tax=Hymenobacter qilianensis TaxID=1385715 RepID=A0A7H0H131_9BACT|nr:carboxypeptidase-like regulatory domain-containing protein [Hymenobacter qilianensis]QNP54247.1 carboxypeptidase regulatory-like domain-containing protein [Hymenobacter qilianensis]
MQQSTRLLALGLLISSSLGLPACGDKGGNPQPTLPPPTQPAPQGQKATLIGQIQPAGAITLITATNAGGGSITATPTSDGSYSFPDLPLGPYTLSFTPATGYVAPPNQAITLVAGGTSVMALTVPPLPKPPAQKALVTGEIKPANAITLVTATNAAGARVTATPTSAGTYRFPELEVGTYTLAFTPAVGYVAPANQAVSHTAAGTTVPLLTVGAAASSLSYLVDGVTVTPAYRFGMPLSIWYATEGAAPATPSFSYSRPGRLRWVPIRH